MGDGCDVFLCHSSTDKVEVRELADALEKRGLRVWLDERELVPGRPWAEALEAAIRASRSVAVLLGPDGRRPWQDAELRGALQLGVEQQKPVIPVLLRGAGEKPELPLFLAAMTWVDLRQGFDATGLDRLEWGIRGTKKAEPRKIAPAKAERSKQPGFFKRNKERLELWALILGISTLALGLLGSVLDLPGKWSVFRKQMVTPEVPGAATKKQFLKAEILDAETHEPLIGVVVWLTEFGLTSQKTNERGQVEFELALPENSRVRVVATHPGYRDRREDPMVGPGRFVNTWLMEKER